LAGDLASPVFFINPRIYGGLVHPPGIILSNTPWGDNQSAYPTQLFDQPLQGSPTLRGAVEQVSSVR
jgi:hypothetical protein